MTTATTPTVTVNGVPVSEGTPIPISDTVGFSSKLNQGNALKVSWSFGDGSPEETVSTNEYQETKVSHKFKATGPFEITEKIKTDNLGTAEVEKKVKVSIEGAKTTTGSATEVKKTTATLGGQVTPNELPISECFFEYGTSTSYGSKKSCNVEPSKLTGTKAVPVSAEVSGLSEATKYHFRLVVKYEGGQAEGNDAVFTTLPKPEAVTGSAGSESESSAVLHATVNPNGIPLSGCVFEYGTGIASGSSVPCSSIPSGSSPVEVSAGVSGLAAGTTYHFQVVATNSGWTALGGEVAFTTKSPVGTGPTGPSGPSGPEPSGPTGPSVPTGPTAPTGPTTEVQGNKVAKIATTSVSVGTSGSFPLKLSCPAGTGSCSDTLTLKTAKAVVASVAGASRSKASILTLASVSFTVAGGQVKTITLHLSATARKLLSKTHTLPAKATIVAHEANGTSHTTVASVTLRLAKHK